MEGESSSIAPQQEASHAEKPPRPRSKHSPTPEQRQSPQPMDSPPPPKLFRARGVLSNDSKYATPARIISMEEILRYRDVCVAPPCEGFDFEQILQQARRDTPVAVSAPVEKLSTSETGFKVHDPNSLSEKEAMVRTVQGVLNKLTEENFNDLMPQVLVDLVFDPEVVGVVVERIFAKAIDEPRFVVLYTRMCHELARFESEKAIREQKEAGHVVESREQQLAWKEGRIRVSIVNKAQDLFAKNFSAAVIEAEEASAIDELAKDRLRKKKIANIRLVAELFHARLLHEKIIMMILNGILLQPKNPSEIDAEVAVSLLFFVGRDMEKHPMFGNVFQRIESFINLKVYSNRVIFQMMNLVDLRSAGWVSKSGQAEAETSPQPKQRVSPSPQLSIPAAPPAQASGKKVVASPTNPGKPLQALPPPASQEVVVRVLKQYSAVCAQPPSALHAALVALLQELSTVIPDQPVHANRMAVACMIVRKACATTDSDTQTALLESLCDDAWERSEVHRGYAWAIVSSIAGGDIDDTPRLFHRMAGGLAMRLRDAAAFVELVRDVFARSANYLDSIFASHDGSFTWDGHFTRAWELFLQAALTASRPLPKPAAILDAFGALKYTQLLKRALPDVVSALLTRRVVKPEDLQLWKKANCTKEGAAAFVEELEAFGLGS